MWLADGWGKSRILGFLCWHTTLGSRFFLSKRRNIFLPYKMCVMYINWAQVEVVWANPVRLNPILDRLQGSSDRGSSWLRAVERSYTGARSSRQLWWGSSTQQTVCGDPRKFFRQKAMTASLVVQWLRIRLPTQGTRVRALVQEDPACRGATEPMRHNYWACTLEPASHNYWARVPQLLKPAHRN